MNIFALIHANQNFSYAVQMAIFLLFLLALRWYLGKKKHVRNMQKPAEAGPTAVEKAINTLLWPLGIMVVVLLLISLLPFT